MIRLEVGGEYSDLAVDLHRLVSAGGKRIRPKMAILTGNILGAENDRLIHLAAAVEMLHTAILVHDNLVDSALLRRGLKILNAKWSPAAATLAGDYAFTIAAKLIAYTDSMAVINLFSETMSTMISGEMTQISRKQGIDNLKDYFNWIHSKTASMFALSTSAAAMLSPVGEETVSRMQEFGHLIGMAFQIMADVRDFTAHQFTLGKPVGNDLRQGTITLPALYYLDTHPEHPTLQAIIHKKNVNKGKLDELINAIRSNGSTQKAVHTAREYIQEGLAVLDYLPDMPQRRELEDLAKSVIG